METKIIPSYLYVQYQGDADLQAFVDAYNNLAQQYLDWFNTVNLPIYTGLSGLMLDWVGAGLYGLPRPTIGTPSGAVYNVGIYNMVTYNSGTVGAIVVSDDVYKRILTWKLSREDGQYMNIDWLKRRCKRFLVGANGTSPAISNTYEISVQITTANTIDIVINYPSDPAMVTILIECLTAKVLDLPWQYNILARSA